MKFYQYWIIIITIILVSITLFNISKMILAINKNTYSKEESKEMDKNVRNLLISMALLSIMSLIYILLVFKQIS